MPLWRTRRCRLRRAAWLEGPSAHAASRARPRRAPARAPHLQRQRAATAEHRGVVRDGWRRVAQAQAAQRHAAARGRLQDRLIRRGRLPQQRHCRALGRRRQPGSRCRSLGRPPVGSRGRPRGAAGHSTPRLYACAVLAFPPAPHVMLALYNYTGVSCFTARRAPRKRSGSAGALSSPGQAQPSAHGGAGKPFTARRRPAATAGMHRVVLRRSGAHRGPGLDGHRAGRQKALPVHAGRDTHEQPRAAGAALRQRGADAAKASRPCACASARACLRSGTAARRSLGPALLSRSNSAAHGTVRGDVGAAAAARRGGTIERQRCEAALCSI